MVRFRLLNFSFSVYCCATAFVCGFVGCGGKSENSNADRIDCEYFTSEDFLHYYARNFSCFDAFFCKSESRWSECVESVESSCEADSFVKPDDEWNREAACACAQSMEDARLKIAETYAQGECGAFPDPYSLWDCPDITNLVICDGEGEG